MVRPILNNMLTKLFNIKRYEMHYGLPIGHKKSKAAKEVSATLAYLLMVTFSLLRLKVQRKIL